MSSYIALSSPTHQFTGASQKAAQPGDFKRLERNNFTKEGTHDGFADGSGVGRIIFATFATHAVGGNKLGCHQAHGVAELGKLTLGAGKSLSFVRVRQIALHL
jgi:hypothetical protein